MKNLLDPKFVEFAKNRVDYKYAEASVNDNYNVSTDDLYDYTPHQYERPRRIAIWYAELKYGSSLDDIFYKKLLEILKESANSENQTENLKYRLTELVNNSIIGDKENGHLTRYAWYYYEGYPFNDKKGIKGQPLDRNDPNTIKKFGEVFIPFVKNWKNDRIELNQFSDLIWNTFDSIRKKLEQEKKKKIISSAPISLAGIKLLIKESSLHKDIKDEIFSNIDEKYQDLKEIVETGLIVHDDTCYDCLGGEDEEDWIPHFQKNLYRFPYDIITEHFVILYKGVKLTPDEINSIKKRVSANK